MCRVNGGARVLEAKGWGGGVNVYEVCLYDAVMMHADVMCKLLTTLIESLSTLLRYFVYQTVCAISRIGEPITGGELYRPIEGSLVHGFVLVGVYVAVVDSCTYPSCTGAATIAED